MTKLQDFRQQYPQYNDMSDQQLADALHNKYYSDIPKSDFYQKIGLSYQDNSHKSFGQKVGSVLDDALNGASSIPSDLVNSFKNLPYTLSQGYTDIKNMSSPDMAKNILSGMASTGRELFNAPYNLQQYLASKGIQINPLAGKIDVPHLNQDNYGKELGVTQNTGAALLQSIPGLPIYGIAPESAELGALSNMMKGTARGAIIGGATNKNPAQGALLGITNEIPGAAIAFKSDPLGSIGLGSVPGVVKSLYGKVSPNSYVKQIYQDVPNLLSTEKAISADKYSQVFNAPTADGLGTIGNKKLSISDKDLPESTFDRSGLKRIYSQFKDEPTIKNAHELQSQLGSADRSLVGKDPDTHKIKDNYQDARSALLERINNSLSEEDPRIAQQYSDASEHYKTRVIPFKITNDDLHKIPQRTAENVKNKLAQIAVKNAYPKLNINEKIIPQVPDELKAIQSELDKRMRNRDIAEYASLVGVLPKALRHLKYLGAK